MNASSRPFACPGSPWLGLLAFVFPLLSSAAQPAPDPVNRRQPLFTSYAAFRDTLDAAILAPGDELDRLWDRLVEAHQVPFAIGDSVAFLYRGLARAVAWHGDFDGWGERRDAHGKGVRPGERDVWIFETTFPADARIDYKVVVDDATWLLDPANPLRAESGFGTNSELRMPGYRFPEEAVRRDDVPGGQLGPLQVTTSPSLGYDVAYRVYTPVGYDTLGPLPVLYVTDGHEYAAEHLGRMIVVLDNLIADRRIEPIVAVFVDPRNPADPAVNRRMKEYLANPAYLRFVADELVPLIDRRYRTSPLPGARGILGTSLGGVNAAFFGLERPDVFENVAIMSPAFWVQPQLYERFRSAPNRSLRIFLSQGTISDGDGGRTLRDILQSGGYTFTYREVNEGHSWGHWRQLLDDVLEYFWGR